MAKTSNKHKVQLLIQILFVFLLNYFFSGWFRQLIFQNLIIAVILSLSMILLIIQYQKNRKIFLLLPCLKPRYLPRYLAKLCLYRGCSKFSRLTKLIASDKIPRPLGCGSLLLFSYLLLFFFQIKTTNIKNTYSLTPSEIDQQITRMNYYPPSQAKLGYILEYKREIKIVEKYIENFIEVLDFNEYFPDYFSLLSLPLFLVGLYWFVKEGLDRNLKGRSKVISELLLFTIIILSLLGVNGKYGPFLIFPFIILFICIGIYGLFRKIRKI